MKIKVGDVISPVGSNINYFINYSPEKCCYYGLGNNGKILKQKNFSKCINIGIAIFNEDAKQIFE